MFRECYFEYAGQSSQPYDLMLCYVSNSNTDFDSGGKFDLKTDTPPRSHETLLYGKDYSAQPLEFEVEFLHLNGHIPFEQMIEIKEWLFGQDGYKTFRLNDGNQGYCLKCIFKPGEDIVDGTGYKGLRCTLCNASPFWYGEEVKTSIDLSGEYSSYNGEFQGGNCTVYIDVDFDTPCRIYPKIEFKNASPMSKYYFQLHNYFDGTKEADVRHVFEGEHSNKIMELNTKILALRNVSNNGELIPLTYLSPTYDTFYLSPGMNRITVKVFVYHGLDPVYRPPQYMTFSYTPIYRLGAF